MNAIATIVGLTLVLASVLVIAQHHLYVPEDARVADLEAMLPQTNCGSCGYPGCHAFAEGLAAGEVLPGTCTVSTATDHQRIASYLGVEVGEVTRQIARLACAGGTNVARNHAQYDGLSSCAAAALVAGGGKGCFWGCIGFADCQEACTFNAIEMNEHLLPVVDEYQCTGCGDCVVACPKDLFSLLPQNHRLWVACRSLEAGEEILDDCQVACTACERCVHDSPDLIHMNQNLPVVDYMNGPATAKATENCPTGAIVWLDAKLGPQKGSAARKIIRQGVIPDAPT